MQRGISGIHGAELQQGVPQTVGDSRALQRGGFQAPAKRGDHTPQRQHRDALLLLDRTRQHLACTSLN